MKSSILPVIVLFALVIALPGCRRESAGGEATETIEPAKPQPAPTGTDAMTQTVDIEAGRSEAEGGGLTSPGDTASTSAVDTAATATATNTPATNAPPPTTTTR